MSNLDVIKVKTHSPYEEKVSYSRLVAVGGRIYVSNTSGINFKTRHLSKDMREQTLQAFTNIETSLAAVDATLADVVLMRVSVAAPEHLQTILEVIGEKFRGIDPVLAFSQTALGELGIEIGVEAFRGVGKADAKYVKIDL